MPNWCLRVIAEIEQKIETLQGAIIVLSFMQILSILWLLYLTVSGTI